MAAPFEKPLPQSADIAEVGEDHGLAAAHDGDALDARRIGEDCVVGQFRCAGAAPVLERMTGHTHHVDPRFGRQFAPTRKPVGHARRAGVIGGGGETQVSEALLQIGQKLGGLGDRGLRVVGIGEPALGRGGRHELGNAAGADGTDGVGLEVAFLPDQLGQECRRDTLGERRGIDNPANGGDERLRFLRCERRKSARQGQDKSREG